MTKLSDTQTVLLSSASNRTGGAVFPIPKSIKARGAVLDRTLKALLKRGLVSEQPVSSNEPSWRENDEGQRTGLAITTNGLTAIGVEPETAVTSTKVTRPNGKLGQVLGAVEGGSGATLVELTDLTAWQPHTTRAALTRLRQRGFGISLETREGRKAYHLAEQVLN